MSNSSEPEQPKNKTVIKGPVHICELCRSLVVIYETKIRSKIKILFGTRNKIETIYYVCPACNGNVTIRETVRELPPAHSV